MMKMGGVVLQTRSTFSSQSKEREVTGKLSHNDGGLDDPDILMRSPIAVKVWECGVARFGAETRRRGSAKGITVSQRPTSHPYLLQCNEILIGITSKGHTSRHCLRCAP